LDHRLFVCDDQSTLDTLPVARRNRAQVWWWHIALVPDDQLAYSSRNKKIIHEKFSVVWKKLALGSALSDGEKETKSPNTDILVRPGLRYVHTRREIACLRNYFFFR